MRISLKKGMSKENVVASLFNFSFSILLGARVRDKEFLKERYDQRKRRCFAFRFMLFQITGCETRISLIGEGGRGPHRAGRRGDKPRQPSVLQILREYAMLDTNGSLRPGVSGIAFYFVRREVRLTKKIKEPVVLRCDEECNSLKYLDFTEVSV